MTELDDHDWYSNQTATFGDRLADARAAIGMTPEDLSRRLGVRGGTLEKWENDTSEPRANQLQIIAGLLNVSLLWLLTGEGEGLSPPDTAPGDGTATPEDMAMLMSEMRQMQSDLVQQADRLGHLQKRLRTALGVRL